MPSTHRSLLAASAFALLFGLPLTARAEPEFAWTPDDGAGGGEGEGTVFKTATVCHDNERDIYGIAAVYERFNWYVGGTYDELWYLQIDGNSGNAGYGGVVSEQLIAEAGRIDHVDCTTDGAGNVFVAHDRQSEDAQWMRIDGDEIWGPYDVDTGACNPVTHRPRIAFGGGDRIMVTVEGYHYDQEYESCEVCAQQYHAYAGFEISGTETLLWPSAGDVHTDYDVEWGDDAFVVAMPYWPDYWPDPLFISTWIIDLENTLAETNSPPENVLQNLEETPEPGWPSRVKLVRSTNDNNESGAMFLRTDTGSYWLDGTGALIDAPLDDATSPQMAVCEYWGSDPAVAHMFASDISWHYEGLFPDGHLVLDHTLTRNHYGVTTDYPYESFHVLDDFAPVACDGADTYDDPEVVLLSRPTSSADGFAYWSMLPNDD